MILIKRLYFNAAFAQLNINSSVSALQIAQTLMGNSVKIDSAFINCESGAYSIFRAQNVVNLPFTEGVLLTTGNAQAVARNANNNVLPGLLDFNLSSPGSTVIQNLMNQGTEDACVLKLFVKPMGDRLFVDYLFGSEEYPEQVNKFYYDAFVFLVKGARPVGGIYNDTNIAKLSNGNPVTVATINNGPGNNGPCSNCQFYRDNSNNSFLGYDGITTSLSASIDVIPCNNYELTLIIADVRDGKFDSGVFLKAGAVNSNGQATVNLNEPRICRGQSVNLMAQSNLVQNFSWSTGETTPEILVTPANTTQYTCFYSYCGVEGYQAITVLVDTLSPATNYSYGSNYLCKGDSFAQPIIINGNGVFWSSNSNLHIGYNGEINLTQTPPGDYPVTFSVTQGPCPAEFTRSISIRSSPELLISGGEDYCSNQLPKAISVSAVGQSPFNFSFTKDGQLIDSTVTSGQLSLKLGKGLYQGFEVTDGNNCKTRKSDSIIQNILDAPHTQFIMHQNDSCQNSGIVIQNLSFIERSSIISYRWFFNDSLVSNQSDLILGQVSPGNFNLKLVSLADNGCTDTLVKSSYIKPSPRAYFNYTSPCYGDTVKIFNQSSSALGSWIESQTWRINNSPFAGDSWVAYDSVYTLFLNVKNNLGCSDSTVKLIRTIPLPRPNFIFSNVCQGDTFSFLNNTFNTSGNALTYSWDVDNNGVIDFLSKDLNYFNPVVGKFWVKLNCRDDKGCKASQLQLAEVYPNPQVSFSLQDSSGCVPFKLNVKNTSSVSGGSYLATYRWELNGVEFSNASNPVKIITNPGKYKLGLTVATNRNCFSSAFSDSILQVFGADKPEFEIFPSDISLLDNLVHVDFLRKSNKHWLLYNGQWYSSFLGLINFEVKDTGWQKIVIVEQNQYNCMDTLNTEIYVKGDYAAYLPNTFTPNSDGLNEQFCLVHFGISDKDFLFRVMTRNNEEVFATTDPSVCWDGRDKNGVKLPHGVYIYEVKLRTQKMVEKNLKGTVLLIR